MKRIIIVLLVCLILCGCANTPAEIPPTTQPRPAVTPTEPSGSYAPGSRIELATNGAVRAYPQEIENLWGIRTVGEDVLVFSGCDTTTITRLTGENLFRIAEVELDIFLSADAPSLYISEDRVIYYDGQTHELVHLDENLREIRRTAMPEGILGDPVLTKDRSRLYYCSDEGLRVMDMETGISRLLKEMYFFDQFMDGLLMNETVLRMAVFDEDGNGEILLLDAQTGALVGGVPEGIALTSGEDYYYAIDPEGTVNQMIFGTGDEMWQLSPADYRESGIFLPASHAALVFHWENEELTLDYYDLATGLRTSSLHLGEQYPESITEDGKGYIYFLTGMEDGTQTICRWAVSETPTDDEAVYTGPWYTWDAPNAAGLSECRAYAQRLSQTYGLEIAIISDAVNQNVPNYDLVPEYQVPVIMDALTQLETLLAQYPQGMFEASVEGMEDGALSIFLVREVRGSYESGSLDSVDGIQFWLDNHAYAALAMGERFENTFHNQIFHVLETRVLSRSIAYYRWDELNPKGFEYDYDFIANQNRDGSEYLEDSTRSFIDTYSMSYPKEDRARVMEFACMPGNEHYFISYTMQKKLRTICTGIREAYGLEDYPDPFLWEQYLESPLTP